MKPLIVFILLTQITAGQEPYKIPFGSNGNTLELTIANTSSLAASEVSVKATNSPAWINFSRKALTIDDLKPGEEKPATFTFSVDKLAPVNNGQTLTFTVKLKSGEEWTKEIKIQVSPPEKFELYQNYPNPFNPTTTICYQLTKESRVSLKVYNLLGQEIATLVDEQQQAGYHQEVFVASRLASGMYIYRIVYMNESGKQSWGRKTMVVVK